jgi:hypothetical protein
MWSMMSSPGESRIESAAACACFLEPIGEDRTYLRGKSVYARLDHLDEHTDEEHRPRPTRSEGLSLAGSGWSANCHGSGC